MLLSKGGVIEKECDSVFILYGLDGEDMSMSAAREGRFALRGESGDGELRNGEEESGDGTWGL